MVHSYVALSGGHKIASSGLYTLMRRQSRNALLHNRSQFVKKKVIAIVYRCLEELLIIYILKYQH